MAALIPLRVQANEMEQRLRHEYTDKTLVLRGFYQGEKLDYDSAGSPVKGSVASGDWTVDGFVRVSSVSLAGKRMSVEAERLPLAVGGQGFEVQHEGGKKKANKGDRLRIVVEDPGGMTAEKAEAALARIFLTPQDRLADLVPAYWKPCVLAASGGGDGKKYQACRFPPEFSIIPGVVAVAENTADAEVKTPDLEIVPIRKGITPPKPLSSPDPEFSAEARRAKYQGTLVLMIVVDKTGDVRDVRVLRPLGLGLDRRAVERVSTWKFDPGRRDGEPVAVELAVEVDFHLY